MDKISKFIEGWDEYNWKAFTDPCPIVFGKWLNVYYHPRRSLQVWDGAENKHTTKELFDYFSTEIGSNDDEELCVEFGEWILEYYRIWNPDDITWIDDMNRCFTTEEIFQKFNDMKYYNFTTPIQPIKLDEQFPIEGQTVLFYHIKEKRWFEGHAQMSDWQDDEILDEMEIHEDGDHHSVIYETPDPHLIWFKQI